MPDRFSGSLKLEKKLLGSKFNLILGNCANEKYLKPNHLKTCNIILAWHDIKYTKKLIDKLPNCKAIVREGVGYDSVDIQYAAKKKIYVFNVPDYGVGEVADHTIGLFLSLLRKINFVNSELKKNLNKWHWSMFKGNKRTNKITFGILGLGRIGTAVALRAKSLGCKVIFFDKYLKTGTNKSLGFYKVKSLKELLLKSDVLSLHVPITNETQKILNSKNLKNLKKNSILINTARGELIDENYLTQLIQQKYFYGVGLDVLASEPPKNNLKIIKLWRSGRYNIILSPHGAFYSEESYKEMRKKAVITAKNFILKKDLTNCVNLSYFQNYKNRIIDI